MPLIGPSFILTKAQKLLLVEQALERLRKLNPAPKTELYFKTHYQLLVSVVLSAQTTDKMVNRCMQPLYDAKEGFTPELALKWGEVKLLSFIKSIGLAPTKAKNVIRLSRLIIEQHGGKVPLLREALEELPGVGRKTANVVLAELAGEPTLAVDTHVFRVTKRLGLHREMQAEAAEKVLMTVVDRKYLPMAHHWFILHGRYTCKAQNPACSVCALSDICPSLPANRNLYKSLRTLSRQGGVDAVSRLMPRSRKSRKSL